MTKISEQLEEEKKKSVIELERKMRQRRMQRERTVMELVRTHSFTTKSKATACPMHNSFWLITVAACIK
jgi:hypothetical protein